jgi:uncharacterized RDD family membrane protein YckC
LKPSVRSLFVGVAVAFFFTLTLAALAQEKPAAPPTEALPVVESVKAPPADAALAIPAVPAVPALRRIDEPTEVPAVEEAPAPVKGKKSRSPQSKERAEALKQRALDRTARAESRSGEAVVNVFSDSVLEENKKADAVVAVFGNASSAGEVVDAVVSVFGDNRVTGPVGAAVVAVFGNSYVNSTVKEGVVVVFGDLELGPDARIDGEVVCIGGSIKRDGAAVIKGHVQNIVSTQVVWLRAWLRECFLKARPLAFAPNLGWAWAIAFAFLAVYTLAALVFRTGVEKCLTTLETRPGFSVLTALLTTLITPVLTVLLVLTGVGIIAVPFIGAGMLCATLFGVVVILAWIGRRITRTFGDGPLNHVALAVIFGGVIVLGLYTVPVVGFLVFKLIGWIGMGAVIYTIVLGMKREKTTTPPPSAGPAMPAFVPTSPAPAPTSADAPAATMMSSGFGAVSSGFVGAGMPVRPSIDVVTSEVPNAGFTSAGAVPPVMPPPVQMPAPAYNPPPSRAGSPFSAATLPRAGFWIRMGAMLLDVVLIGMIVGLTSSVLPHFMQMNHGPGGLLVALAIYGAAMWKTKGTTIGGIVCGLKVVRLDDREIDWPTAAVRALSCFLSLVVGGLGFIWVIFDADRQSWHDKIAGTTVVRMPKGVSLL